MNESRVEELLVQLIGEVRRLIDTTERVVPASRRKAEQRSAADRSPLSQDDFDSLDSEIDFEWWFETYGEDPLPTKFMNQKGLPYSREELVYLFRRMNELSQYSSLIVNDGTHQFKFVGKVYCKAEKNTVNCFACVPVK